jgi:hypothetical protein
MYVEKHRGEIRRLPPENMNTDARRKVVCCFGEEQWVVAIAAIITAALADHSNENNCPPIEL